MSKAAGGRGRPTPPAGGREGRCHQGAGAAGGRRGLPAALRAHGSRPARQGPCGRQCLGPALQRRLHPANEFGCDVDYAELTRKLLAALTARPDVVRPSDLPREHRQPPQGRRPRGRRSAQGRVPGVVRAPNSNSPSEAKSYIAGLDFLTAARMHACIAAFSAGVPVVPVAYSRKFLRPVPGGAGLSRGSLPVRVLGTDEALAYLPRPPGQARPSSRRPRRSGLQVVDALLQGYKDDLARVF